MVRCCVGFAHCPPNRLEEAFNYVNINFNFEKLEDKKLKIDFLEYVSKNWLHNKDFPVTILNC